MAGRADGGEEEEPPPLAPISPSRKSFAQLLNVFGGSQKAIARYSFKKKKSSKKKADDSEPLSQSLSLSQAPSSLSGAVAEGAGGNVGDPFPEGSGTTSKENLKQSKKKVSSSQEGSRRASAAALADAAVATLKDLKPVKRGKKSSSKGSKEEEKVELEGQQPTSSSSHRKSKSSSSKKSKTSTPGGGGSGAGAGLVVGSPSADGGDLNSQITSSSDEDDGDEDDGVSLKAVRREKTPRIPVNVIKVRTRKSKSKSRSPTPTSEEEDENDVVIQRDSRRSIVIENSHENEEEEEEDIHNNREPRGHRLQENYNGPIPKLRRLQTPYHPGGQMKPHQHRHQHQKIQQQQQQYSPYWKQVKKQQPQEQQQSAQVEEEEKQEEKDHHEHKHEELLLPQLQQSQPHPPPPSQQQHNRILPVTMTSYPTFLGETSHQSGVEESHHHNFLEDPGTTSHHRFLLEDPGGSRLPEHYHHKKLVMTKKDARTTKGPRLMDAIATAAAVVDAPEDDPPIRPTSHHRRGAPVTMKINQERLRSANDSFDGVEPNQNMYYRHIAVDCPGDKLGGEGSELFGGGEGSEQETTPEERLEIMKKQLLLAENLAVLQHHSNELRNILHAGMDRSEEVVFIPPNPKTNTKAKIRIKKNKPGGPPPPAAEPAIATSSHLNTDGDDQKKKKPSPNSSQSTKKRATKIKPQSPSAEYKDLVAQLEEDMRQKQTTHAKLVQLMTAQKKKNPSDLTPEMKLLQQLEEDRQKEQLEYDLLMEHVNQQLRIVAGEAAVAAVTSPSSSLVPPKRKAEDPPTKKTVGDPPPSLVLPKEENEMKKPTPVKPTTNTIQQLLKKRQQLKAQLYAKCMEGTSVAPPASLFHEPSSKEATTTLPPPNLGGREGSHFSAQEGRLSPDLAELAELQKWLSSRSMDHQKTMPLYFDAALDENHPFDEGDGGPLFRPPVSDILAPDPPTKAMAKSGILGEQKENYYYYDDDDDAVPDIELSSAEAVSSISPIPIPSFDEALSPESKFKKPPMTTTMDSYNNHDVSQKDQERVLISPLVIPRKWERVNVEQTWGTDRWRKLMEADSASVISRSSWHG